MQKEKPSAFLNLRGCEFLTSLHPGLNWPLVNRDFSLHSSHFSVPCRLNRSSWTVTFVTLPQGYVRLNIAKEVEFPPSGSHSCIRKRPGASNGIQGDAFRSGNERKRLRVEAVHDDEGSSAMDSGGTGGHDVAGGVQPLRLQHHVWCVLVHAVGRRRIAGQQQWK